MVWKNIPPYERPNWARMNEGQRRYAMEQYNLALVRRGLPIDHPIPEQDPVEESEYETAHEESDSETIVPAESDGEGYDTAVELEEELHDLRDASEDDDMAPPGGRTSTSAPVAGPSGTGKGGKALKRHGTSDSGIEEAFGLPGTGQGQGQSDPPGGEPIETCAVSLPRPTLKINSYIRYYRKVHRFLSWGIAYQVLSTTENDVDYRNISTPFAQIPWDRPYLYLTYSEWSSLPAGCRTSKVRVEVRARNVRVAFPTNSSGTELATLNQNKDLCYAIGLNKTCNIVNVQYLSFQDGQPMIPLTYEQDAEGKHKDLNSDLYGRLWTDEKLTVPRHQMGIPTPLPTYAIVPYYKLDPEGGYPCLQHYYKDFYGDGINGQAICRAEYKPVMGLLKQPPQTITYGYPKRTQNYSVPRQGGNNQCHTDKFAPSGTSGDIASFTSSPNSMGSAEPGILTQFHLLEKSQLYRHGFEGMLPVQAQPSLHVAVQPTPALDTKALGGRSNSNFTDTQAYWECICEMEVNTQYKTPFPLFEGIHGQTGDLIWRNGGNELSLKDYNSMFGGLYTS